jgi:plasmid stabilization system protein ParE
LAQIIYSENALVNLEQMFNFLLEHDQVTAIAAAEAITNAIDTLKNHPLIGRCIEGAIRELIISYGR